ncbi:MAG: flagellar filament capping protein FliD [Oscillospiraceae bacterium]|nr:flagellar filament capping protein FliD [Oscillospiraceae bacterium]
MSDLMRLAGLNSGFDTESMIQKMMSAYQTKIDNQSKKLTKLQWQQEAYRDVISKLSGFKGKYFDILKRDSYLLSPSTFSKFKATITNKFDPDKSPRISVTSASNAVEGNYSFKVKQTASAAKMTGRSMTPESFKLDLEHAANTSDYEVIENEDGTKSRSYNFALDVKVGNVSKTVEFTVDIAEDENGKIDMGEFSSKIQDSLNQQFHEEFGTTGKNVNNANHNVTGGVDENGNEFFLTAKVADDGKTMEFLVGGNAAVTIGEKEGNFGLTQSSYLTGVDTTSVVTGINSVAVTVKGVTKSVSFDGVSKTYFDSRDEEGNEEILDEYNRLKEAAYRKKNGLAEDEEINPEDLEAFEYSSAQAAKDRNAEALTNALNDAYKDEFGEGSITFSISATGYMMAVNENNVAQEFTITSTSGGTLGLGKAFTTNKFAEGASLYEMGIASEDEVVSFKINGQEIKVRATDSIEDLLNAVNKSGAGVTMTYSKLDNKFVITANDMGNSGRINIEDEKGFAAKLGLDAPVVEGTNAIIEIDGVEIVHNDNSYTIDGHTISFEDAELDTEYTIGVKKDYTDVKQVIKDFVNDYNKLLDDIYGHINTAKARDDKNRTYDPLTDAEMEEMTEKEIEKWNERAKQGAIYHDTTVTMIMSKLRTVLYDSIKLEDGSSFGLVNLGIRTVSYEDNPSDSLMGKLRIDEDKLDEAFEKNPDAIARLFTDSSESVMRKINNVIDSAIQDTGSNKGSLVRKAGLEGHVSAKDNQIYKQMEAIQKRINSLKTRYEKKEEYWWSVFTRLESMMADFNSQSAYMQSYLSNNSGNNSQ